MLYKWRKEKMKKILSLIIIAMLSLSMLSFAARATSTPPTTGPCIYADPATHVDNFYPLWPTPTNPRWNFSVMAANLTNIFTVAVSIKSQNNSAAKVVNYYTGPGITSLGLTEQVGYWDIANGDIQDLTGFKTSKYNVTTATELWIIEVEGEDFTDLTTIDIYTQYACGSGSPILTGDCPYDHNVTLTNNAPPPPPPKAPTAAFSWTPPTIYEGDTVNFDASASTGGYDGNANTTISEYRWDWTNDGTYDHNDSVPTASNSSFTGTSGTYTVKLQVYAPNATYPYNASYVMTGEITHPLKVWPKATGRFIDLYTQNWRYGDDATTYPTPFTGENPPYLNGTQVDSYAPQDLVCLYAKLTYNGEPICYKEVAFEIHGPTNDWQNITLYRQVKTNGSGIAEICFRIPWADFPGHAEAIVFGNWTAVAKASVANQEVEDWHWWYVHWILDIVAETVSPDPVYELSSLTITADVHNYALTPRNYIWAVTLYDELSVPVGSATYDLTMMPGGATWHLVGAIYVPEWAYVGIGTVYKDLFTRLPWICGICFCPEYSETVEIKGTPSHIPPF